MFKNKNIKAIIFDLDDTLYPEKEFIESGFWAVGKYLASKYKLPRINLYNILETDFKRGNRGKNFNLLLDRVNLPRKELKQLISIYRNHKPRIKLHKDAAEILTYFIKDKRMKLGLISDGIVNTQKNKLRTLKLNTVFDVIVLSDVFGKKYRKPNAKPFEVILKKMKVKPEEAIYVADNPQKDFIGAKRLGIFTIRIKRKGGVYEKVEETINNRADLAIYDLIKLKKICTQKR